MAQSKKQVRNLMQYRNLSDEEFEEMWLQREASPESMMDFEERIEKKIKEFSQDYDIDDLKINDRETLRSLVQSVIALEDYEKIIYQIRSGEISQTNINIIDRISKVMSDIRKDISSQQTDLNITRKIRKSDKESSVVSYIANLKDQARQFYESKMSYVYCECGMLLGTVWCLYPEEVNAFQFVCRRILDDGSKCGKKLKITSQELMNNGGTNRTDVTPEALL